jgi:hypothetical protein
MAGRSEIKYQPGDRVQLVYSAPSLRRTPMDALANPGPGNSRSAIPKNAISDKDDFYFGTVLKRVPELHGQQCNEYVILKLDRPVYTSRVTNDGSAEYKELLEIAVRDTWLKYIPKKDSERE